MKPTISKITVAFLLLLVVVTAFSSCAEKLSPNGTELIERNRSFNQAIEEKSENCGMLALSSRTATAEMPHYGRTVLAELNNAEGLLYAYDKISEGISDLAATVFLSDAPSTIDGDELYMVYEAIQSDFPEYFWLDSRYSYSGNSRVISFTPSYTMSGSTLEAAKAALEAVVSSMISDLDGKSDYEKAKLLHDRLAIATRYASGKNDQTAYGALVDGTAVCAGYTRAYQLLLRRVGISAWYVVGSSYAPNSSTLLPHAWNLVELDGKLYYTDVTWDDQGDSEEELFYAYFNITTEYLTEDHIISTEGLYKYYNAVCTAIDANYFTVNGGIYSEFDVDSFAVGLKNNGYTYRVFITGDADAFAVAFRSNISAVANKAGLTGSISASWRTLGREYVFTVSGSVKDSVTETTKSPENANAPETTKIPEITKVPETTKISETVKTPETTISPETIKAPESTTVHTTTRPSETTKIPETTAVPNTTEGSDTTKLPEKDTTERPNTETTDDTSETYEITEDSEIAISSGESNTDEPTVGTNVSTDSMSSDRGGEIGGLHWQIVVGIIAVIIVGFFSLNLLKKKK